MADYRISVPKGKGPKAIKARPAVMPKKGKSGGVPFKPKDGKKVTPLPKARKGPGKAAVGKPKQDPGDKARPMPKGRKGPGKPSAGKPKQDPRDKVKRRVPKSMRRSGGGGRVSISVPGGKKAPSRRIKRAVRKAK